MKRFLSILILLQLAGPVLAQPFSSYLDTTYNLDGRSDWFLGLCRVGNKYYSSSWTNANGIADYGLSRIEANGFLDSAHIFYDSTTYDDAIDIAVLDSGKIGLVLQYKNIISGDWQYGLAITDTEFHQIAYTIKGIDTLREVPQSLCFSNNEIVATGSIRNLIQPGSQNIYLVAWDTRGNFKWERQLGTPQYAENSYGIVSTTDGGYMVAGYRKYLSNNRYDWLIIKTDSMGHQQWERTFGNGGNSKALSVLRRRNGTYIITGATQVSISGNSFDAEMICLTEGGTLLWDSLYQHPGFKKVILNKTIEARHGGLVSIGTLQDDSTAVDYAWLYKTDSLGNTEWSREIIHQTNNHQYLRDLEQTPDGGYLLVGSVFHSPNDAWVVKVDSVGCMVGGCDTIHTSVAPLPKPGGVFLGNPVPNPTGGAVSVSYHLPKGKNGIIQIVDIYGHLLQTYSVHFTETNLELDLSNVPASIVFCILQVVGQPPATKAILVE